MEPERARERYVLKVELLDVEEVSTPVLLATLPLIALKSGPIRYLKRQRAEDAAGVLPVLDPSAGEREAPTISQRPLNGLEAMHARLGPDERLVTISNRESGEAVLRFLVPAGEDANEIVVELHHDYKRYAANEWRKKWLDVLAVALQAD